MSSIGVRFTRSDGSTFVQQMLSRTDAVRYLNGGHSLRGEVVECSCAMTESSMTSCVVHGYDAPES